LGQGDGRRYSGHGTFLSGDNDGALSSCRADMPQGWRWTIRLAFAAVGMDPAIAPEAITAADRRKAGMLHSDIPGTGDALAFIRVQHAY